MTVETDFAPLYVGLKAKRDIPVGQIMPGDRTITVGTQEYAKKKAAE